MARIVAAWKPDAPNRSRAAARIAALVCSEDLLMSTIVGQQLLTFCFRRASMGLCQQALTKPREEPTMNDTDVLVVGAGPTGLALGASLTARGVRAVLVDALAEGQNTTRAAVVNARTLEVLEDLDVSQRMVKAGLMAARFIIPEGRQVLIAI